MDATLLSQVVGILALVVLPLMLLGAAAVRFGADSRPCVGDDHGRPRRGDWI